MLDVSAVIRPNFFIVGAPKCGTTALYSYLKEHPEIFMSPIKEPQFFAVDTLGDQRRIQTWEDYLSCFAGAEGKKKIGEASVQYLSSRSAPKEIKASSPAAQIIIMLRNPVDVMYALHGQLVFDNHEPLVSFEAALEAEKGIELAAWQRRPGSTLGYRAAVTFSEQVRTYFEVYGRENVHVIIHDDFKRDTGSVYRSTLRFLDVSLAFQPDFRVINPSKRLRSMVLQKFLKHPPQVLRQVSHAMIPLPVRRFWGSCVSRLNVVYEPRPPMNTELRSRLQREFEPEVEKLSRLLDRDLSVWSTT